MCRRARGMLGTVAPLRMCCAWVGECLDSSEARKERSKGKQPSCGTPSLVQVMAQSGGAVARARCVHWQRGMRCCDVGVSEV